MERGLYSEYLGVFVIERGCCVEKGCCVMKRGFCVTEKGCGVIE